MSDRAPQARSSAELMRAVIDNLAEGVLILDSERKVITANPAAAAILGLPLEQIVGNGWPLALGDPQRDAVKDLLRPDGSRVWLSISTTRVELPAPHAGNGVVASFVDVTSAVEARHALETSEHRFRDLTELSADWYWEQDAELRFTDMSMGAKSMGIPPQDFIGKRRWDFPWINMTEADWAAHRATIERHEPFRDLELRRRDASGEVTIISVSGKPVFDAQGRFTGYRGVGRNITQRKRTKRSLREIVERFRSLTELSSDWYWEMDAELRFTYVSQGIRKVRGVGPESLIGKRRWEAKDVIGGGEEMARHRATLEGHLPFKDFVLAR
ncbi:MAG: PAS domain S-box protein, partial [Pseudomonadota bacterium]